MKPDYTKYTKDKFGKEFFKKFDHLMVNRKNPKKSLMGVGIDCVNGWYNIVWDLTDTIDHYIKNNPEHISNFEIVQIKQKFGGLRYYVDNGDKLISGMIWFAESLSFITCEKCGAPGVVDGSTSYIQTLCPLHTVPKERSNSVKLKQGEDTALSIPGSSNPDYKKGFAILLEYWDSLPDEEKPKIDKELRKIGL